MIYRCLYYHVVMMLMSASAMIIDVITISPRRHHADHVTSID